jgi:hypothetical protein
VNYVVALYDFAAQADGDLDFKVGDRIEVIERTENAEDWWTGRLNGRTGVFPGNVSFPLPLHSRPIRHGLIGDHKILQVTTFRRLDAMTDFPCGRREKKKSCDQVDCIVPHPTSCFIFGSVTFS